MAEIAGWVAILGSEVAISDGVGGLGRARRVVAILGTDLAIFREVGRV